MAETPVRGTITLLDTAGTAESVYGPVPTATKTIIRSIIVCNETDTEILVTVGVHTSAADAVGRRLIREMRVNPHENVDALPENSYVVLNATEHVYALTKTGTAANAATVMASGYEVA